MSRRVVPLVVAGAVLGSLPALMVSGPLSPALAATGPATAAATVQQMDSGRLALAVARLRVLGSVLYVAAHPDDENTRLLAWLVGERGLRASYLSLTRGEGGQNLLGSEQGELFGLLRAAELFEARRIDGAAQYFGEAVDFGYSKSTAETLERWGHDELLAEVVRTICTLRPDVVVTRFSPQDAKTHGHHSASAVLAREAFDAAADPTRFGAGGDPPWQATRLLWNKSTWSKPEDADWSKDLPIDVGSYSPLLGASWGEIAGRSRSMHKSQGFGAEQQRGPIVEYFELLAGTPPPGDFLSGIDFSWKRAGGDDALIEVLERASRELRPDAPHEIVPLLLDARRRIRALPDSHWKTWKLAEIDDVIAACAGLWLEAVAERYEYTPGDAAVVTATALNRSPLAVELVAVRIADQTAEGGSLAQGAALDRKLSLRIAGDASAPAASDLEAIFELRVGGEQLRLVRAVDYRWVDPVGGELRRPLEIHPAVTVNLDRQVLVFAGDDAKQVRVTARSVGEWGRGTLSLELPEGWNSEPAEAALVLDGRGAEQTVAFRIRPVSAAALPGELRAVARAGDHRFTRALVRVEYPHIPILTVFSPAAATVVRVALERGIARIGYVEGAGDAVAASLADVGYDVTALGDEELAAGDLGRFDAIVTGVRAFNVKARLHVHHRRLMDYVEAGGTLLVQYNTVNRLSSVGGPVGPYPFEIGRDRVTDESSALRMRDAADPVFHHPNEIGAADFDGWVQERGLYFAAASDARYRRPLAMHDPGEDWTSGALLVARHGKGRFVYTGLSFFRQLPAGVPGAYRLLANLLAAPAGGDPEPAPAETPSTGATERADDQAGVRH